MFSTLILIRITMQLISASVIAKQKTAREQLTKNRVQWRFLHLIYPRIFFCFRLGQFSAALCGSKRSGKLQLKTLNTFFQPDGLAHSAFFIALNLRLTRAAAQLASHNLNAVIYPFVPLTSARDYLEDIPFTDSAFVPLPKTAK